VAFPSTGCSSSALFVIVTLFLPQRRGRPGDVMARAGAAAREVDMSEFGMNGWPGRRGAGLRETSSPARRSGGCRGGRRGGARRAIDVSHKVRSCTWRTSRCQFDGFKALNKLTLSIEAGELRAIIGPNGAGKTTMMDVITGKTRPDAGKVIFGQTHRPDPHDRAADRHARHRPQVPEAHGVRAATCSRTSSWPARPTSAGSLLREAHRQQRERIDEVLELIGLTDPADRISGPALSHGQKQWLEIGMLLMQEPQLLLLDEPVAGMTDEETERTAELLRPAGRQAFAGGGRARHGLRRAIARTVTVLHQGSVLAEGADGHGAERPRVIEVYLGA
jgi:urea transport system ATP-binding protein